MYRSILKIALLLCLPLIATSGKAAEKSEPSMARTPLIIDTDMTGDDWLAILYLLADPKVDVKAITVSGSGQAHAIPGGLNALTLLDLAKAPDIPVATGSETPIQGINHFPDHLRERADQLAGWAAPSRRPEPQPDAPQLIIDTLQASDIPVTIVALGPWTNIAHAFEKAPAIAGKTERIIAMGGAVDVPGNVHTVPAHHKKNNTAEWNFYLDPVSVERVVRNSVPIDLIPLDATNFVPMTEEYFQRISQQPPSPILQFALDSFKSWKNRDGKYTWSFWDPLAAVAVSNPEVVTWEDATLIIDTHMDSNAAGTLTRNSSGRAVRFATTADKDRFYDLFTNGINRYVEPDVM
ncbi:nucleoside hydrolase [Sansalvadorimonas verongulae]|uniref:nucleoside hydrolase n=1 Tax=Sansalvadorimonas verongulae TaxID=2172824 RepID=UPI0012BCA97C|nr:nucleoside hydrolase [Sansalvadorimonas verongulae]MTI14596.1 nucleoside hydrolase [Sansalvadorimonas verongulae]